MVLLFDVTCYKYTLMIRKVWYSENWWSIDGCGSSWWEPKILGGRAYILPWKHTVPNARRGSSAETFTGSIHIIFSWLVANARKSRFLLTSCLSLKCSYISYYQNVNEGFIGCLSGLNFRGKDIGNWKRNNNVIPCSNNVEPGFYFGKGGGSLMVGIYTKAPVLYHNYLEYYVSFS